MTDAPPPVRISTSRIVAACASGVGLAVVVWAFGGDLLPSVACGIMLAAFILVGAGFSGTDNPVRPEKKASIRSGLRSDVVRAAWSLRTVRGAVTDAGYRQLRSFARRRLERFGIDLLDPTHLPQLENLVGRDVGALLTGARGLPSIYDVEQCLDALERMTADRKGER